MRSPQRYGGPCSRLLLQGCSERHVSQLKDGSISLDVHSEQQSSLEDFHGCTIVRTSK